MNLSDFDFRLADAQIARFPVEPRDHSRLMLVNRVTGLISHHEFCDLPKHLSSHDRLVLNNSKVIPARLFASDENNRRFEVLLLDPKAEGTWKCLVRPGKRIGRGHLAFPDGVQGRVVRDGRNFRVEFSGIETSSFFDWLDRNGETPLPPYLKRESKPEDSSRYQTVYARTRGSVAAPTAGLHFTLELLDSVRAVGAAIEEITLHVGYGTFAPVEEAELASHRLHEERYDVLSGLPSRIEATRSLGGRVIAVGTTAARTLESCSDELSGRTRLFILPGYSFRRVDALITNFHLPRSSLLMLVCAFLGREKTLRCYDEAIREGYRFYSYGDAMFIT